MEITIETSNINPDPTIMIRNTGNETPEDVAKAYKKILEELKKEP